VAADHLRECIFSLVPAIFCEQLQVGIAHLHKYIAASARNPPTNLQNFRGWTERKAWDLRDRSVRFHYRLTSALNDQSKMSRQNLFVRS
jgi:hypothetical protein